MDKLIIVLLVLFMLINTGIDAEKKGFVKGHNQCLKTCNQKLGKDSALLSEIKYK